MVTSSEATRISESGTSCVWSGRSNGCAISVESGRFIGTEEPPVGVLRGADCLNMGVGVGLKSAKGG